MDTRKHTTPALFSHQLSLRGLAHAFDTRYDRRSDGWHRCLYALIRRRRKLLRNADWRIMVLLMASRNILLSQYAQEA